MSASSYLEHLRNKPVHVRRHIALWSSLGTTAIIFAFWIASFTSVGSDATGALAKVVSNAQTPAQNLTAAVGDFFGGIRDMIFSPKKVEYKSVEVRAGNN